MNEQRHTTLPRTRPGTPRWLRLLAVALIFLSGGVVGAALGASWMREYMLVILQDPGRAPDRILAGLHARLDLSEEQSRRVEEIVRRRHARMESHRAASYPLQLAEFQAIRTEVAAVLSAEQQGKWVSLCDSVESRYLPRAPLGPPPAELIFTKFDTNNDGALTEEEVPPMMWRRLRNADANNDGKVTRAEYDTALGP